ncbi:MAG: aminotransferase class I/II-fold pyridoxal phosphate-dependent enzyme, partial [Ilumatobacteraceae bacterium]
FEPTYQMHAQIARVVGSTVVEGARDDDFTLDPSEIERVMVSAAPHVTFLTSPNNPTGLVEPRARIEQLLDQSPGLVVADEAYAQFANWSALTMIHDDLPLVVTRTFSKTWSMAGVRLGYVVGPPWFVSELVKVALPYHLDTAKQIAGRLALRYVDEMDERVRLIVSERERLSAAMAAMPIDVTPSGANFILFRPTRMGGRELWQRLLDRSVLVRDCSGWPRLTDRLRVTVGTAAENDALLAALTEILT